MRNKKIILAIGIISLLISIYQAIALKQAHFYTLFSIGMTLILFEIYSLISKVKIFKNWNYKKIVLFFTALIISCIIIDKIGIFLNYWDYPAYTNLFDEILKYLFEWAIPFLYISLSFAIGYEIFKKMNLGNKTSFLLAIIIFGTLIGLITDTINMGVDSWRILNMPLTNMKIGGYFIMFTTIGYWIMIIITLSLYKIVDKMRFKN